MKIAVLPGDGIGPEVINEAVKVLKRVCEIKGHELELEYGMVGACAIDECGDPYPEKTHKLCMESDAVLFGALGDPKYDNDPNAKVRPEQGLHKMRKSLGLFANIRPVNTYKSLLYKSPLRADLVENADFICVRELTGGLYFGKPQGRSEDGNTAYDTCVYTREEIERIVKLSYLYAQKRKKKLTLVDKANILATSRLWRQVTKEISADFPDVETEYLYVDNAAMRMIQNPRDFDVIVTENMFGDILTDEASVISGSMGLLPSASVGTYTSLFEPIHGSYPQAAGKNIANPMAAILSVAMMFETAFNMMEEGKMIRDAVEKAIADGIVTVDLCAEKSYSTSEVGAYIVNELGANS
jgi:3-isopropylmalate dehydrogenase